MKVRPELRGAKAQRSVRIVAGDPEARTWAMHDAVARRAYRIYESRGFLPGHDWEDWLLAESEIVRPLHCGLLELDGRMTVNTDASCFEGGEITAYVEPHCLTLSGIAGPCKERRRAEAATKADLKGERIFRAMDLPAEVEPSGARSKFNGCMLELSLLKASGALEPAHAKAA